MGDFNNDVNTLWKYHNSSPTDWKTAGTWKCCKWIEIEETLISQGEGNSGRVGGDILRGCGFSQF